MRLWSGAPFWLLRDGLCKTVATLPRDCDVAIVGAGITGALLADSLAAAGFSVTVLDRRSAGEGSTAACTGILTYELDRELNELAENIGKDRAVLSYQATVGGVRMLRALAATLPERCGFSSRPSLYLGRHRRDTERLQREADMRQLAGIDVEFLSRQDVEHTYGFDSRGALRTNVAAIVDAVALTRALLDRASLAGAVVCPETAVTSWTSTEHGATIETSRGPVRAQWIVIATGYEIPPQLRDDIVSLHSSYALVTRPVDPPPEWKDQCTVWDTNDPYFYLRAAEGGRIVIGGEDLPFRDPAWRDRILPSRIHKLERQLRQLFPSLETETEFTWAGTFGETADSLPYIGPLTGIPRALFALGYGGNGIVFSAIASQILRDVILGEGHELLDLFSFDRLAVG